MNKLPDHIIIFDGVCNLCSGIVKFLIKKDKRNVFKFASLQSQIGQELLKKYEINSETIDTFVYIRKEIALKRSTAGLYVAKDLARAWKFLFIFIVFPSFIRDFFYNIIAWSRYRIWGRSDSCLIPDDDISDRFID